MESSMDKRIEKHNAIEKALVILGQFAINNQALSTMEISRMLGYHKATASRTLLLLKKYGFLEQNEQTKRFKLGPAIMNLGLSINRSLKNDIIQIAKPYLDKLRDTLEESITLEVLSGRNTLITYIAEGPRRIRLGADVGMFFPSIATAGAKAILAFIPSDEWDTFLGADITGFAPKSITDHELFSKQLAQIKQTRIAFDIGEHDPDLNAIGSPIFNIEGTPVAAVVVVGLASRIGCNLDSQMADETRKTAEYISKRLYYIDHVPDSLWDWLESIKVEGEFS
jgi:IclR family pca regulon transcriptional regulator